MRDQRRFGARPASCLLLLALTAVGCTPRGPGEAANRGATTTPQDTAPDPTAQDTTTQDTMVTGSRTTLDDGRIRVVTGDAASDQFADLRLPDAAGAVGVVVLVHGGFWREGFGLDLMEPLAEDLVARGWATWNLEYRRTGDGGGYPATFADVAAGTDLLATLAAEGVAPVDLDRVVVVGHSAGGHLAAWLAGRATLPVGAVGAEPAVRPCAAVSLAGVLDLATAASQGIGGSAVEDLLGVDPADDVALVAVTSPQAMLPLGVPLLAVHGASDTIVPLWQSTEYVTAATAVGDPAEVVVEDGDHFAVIDPAHALWAAVLDRLPQLC